MLSREEHIILEFIEKLCEKKEIAYENAISSTAGYYTTPP